MYFSFAAYFRTEPDLNQTTNPIRHLALLSLTVALAACGGGGGSSAPAAGPNPPPPAPAPIPTPVVPVSGTLATSVAAASYAANSPQADAFATLNDARQHAGAGLIAQSEALDISAQAHASYLTTNILTVGLTHVEDSSLPGYYADTFYAREAKAGYSFANGTEVIGGCSQGALYTYGLLDTVYHGAALLSANVDIGYGLGADGAGFPMCVADLGTATGVGYNGFGQVPAAGAMVAYPYAGQTNVLDTFYVTGEIPRVSITVLPNATAGAPVIVSLVNADYLNLGSGVHPTVTAFSMADSSNTPVPAQLLATQGVAAGSGVILNTDANLAAGVVVLVPESPLAKNTTYTVTFSATLGTGATALSKAWRFTTNP